MLDFLEPVADSSDQQVTTDPWRLAPIKPSPFAAKLIETGVRKLKTLAKMFQTPGRVAANPRLSLKPGSRLVREWHGRTHTVTVTEDGFEYAGVSYPSLTKIAAKITGVHWSGPRFFGLKASNEARSGEGGASG